MKNIQIPTAKRYIMAFYLSMAEMPPKGNFVPYAKGSPESSYFPRENQYQSLQMAVAHPEFLQNNPSQEIIAKAPLTQREEPGLLFCPRLSLQTGICGCD